MLPSQTQVIFYQFSLCTDVSKFVCEPAPLHKLLVRLGAGYNERYMSVVRPQALRPERVQRNDTTAHAAAFSDMAAADMPAHDGDSVSV